MPSARRCDWATALRLQTGCRSTTYRAGIRVGHMNLVTELESHFGISLEMDEIVGLDSVGAVRALVARALGACQDRCAEAHPLPPSDRV